MLLVAVAAAFVCAKGNSQKKLGPSNLVLSEQTTLYFRASTSPWSNNHFANAPTKAWMKGYTMVAKKQKSPASAGRLSALHAVAARQRFNTLTGEAFWTPRAFEIAAQRLPKTRRRSLRLLPAICFSSLRACGLAGLFASLRACAGVRASAVLRDFVQAVFSICGRGGGLVWQLAVAAAGVCTAARFSARWRVKEAPGPQPTPQPSFCSYDRL